MSTIWFSVSEPRRYFRIGTDFGWPAGDLVLTNLDFEIKQVSEKRASEFEVEKSQAFSGFESSPSENEKNNEEETEPDVLSDIVNEGIQIGEDILSNLESDEALTLAKDLAEEAMGFVSDYVDSRENENTGESLTGLNLRSLLRSGLKDVRFSVQQSGDSTKEK